MHAVSSRWKVCRPGHSSSSMTGVWATSSRPGASIWRLSTGGAWRWEPSDTSDSVGGVADQATSLDCCTSHADTVHDNERMIEKDFDVFSTDGRGITFSSLSFLLRCEHTNLDGLNLPLLICAFVICILDQIRTLIFCCSTHIHGIARELIENNHRTIACGSQTPELTYRGR